MIFAPLLAPLVGLLLRDIFVKFFVFTAVFGLVAILAPVALGYLSTFISGGSLTSAFTGLPGGVWFFLDAFNLGMGIPLVLSALVARFIIRRLPVIG